MQNKLKFAIIGCGNMGSSHAKNLFYNKINNAELACLCDIDATTRKKLTEAYPRIPVFDDYKTMFENAKFDCVIVATPHYSHPEISKFALLQNKNVLTEKPIGIMPSEINALISVAKKSDKKFGIMFNQRTNSLFKKARDLVKGNEIGDLKRVVWIITNWYRTQSYYDGGGWRATWRGEGGGILTNQAPHQLDIMQWICGMPKSVTAKCEIGKYHNISVEDDAELSFEFENGATGVFITSTGECPGTNRLEISGDKGKIVLENNQLKIWRLKKNEREFCFTEKQGFYQPDYEYSTFKSENEIEGHIAILQNFCNSVLFNEPLIAEGTDGIYQSQITSAAYLSHFKGEKQLIPVSSSIYEKELKKHYETEKEMEIKLYKAKSKFDEDASARWQVRW